jgi:hypothetical protein
MKEMISFISINLIIVFENVFDKDLFVNVLHNGHLSTV